LPESGEIRSARLNWTGPETLRLAENRFLALSVDVHHQGQLRSPAHVQIEFGETDVRATSLFGFVRIEYPRAWVIGFNRPQLEPWWGAWSPPILALTAAGVVVWLLFVWAFLGLLYSPVVWLVAFYGNRNLSLRQSCKVAGAALMPGALFLIVVMVTYGLGAMDLVELLAAVAAHFVIDWVYLVASSLALRRDPNLAPAKANPFKQPQAKG
jgi:hypothetical protein